MAVVARARRARRGVRRSARRLAGLALLALAFGFGSWHPAAASPSLAPTELIAAPVAVVAPAATVAEALSVPPVMAAPVATATVPAATISVAADVAVQSLSTGPRPVELRPLALAGPVDTRVRGRAVRSAAATRAPPHAA